MEITACLGRDYRTSGRECLLRMVPRRKYSILWGDKQGQTPEICERVADPQFSTGAIDVWRQTGLEVGSQKSYHLHFIHQLLHQLNPVMFSCLALS